MSDKRKCYNCEYFHIRQEPIPHHMDAGLAECKKHNMVVDFYNHGKLKRLECVEGQEILDMSDCKIISDDDAVFYDGFVYIISRNGDYSKKEDPHYTIDVKMLNAEYDSPISLASIAKKYPNVHKVIFDDALKGYVFNYSNHRDGCWEQVGTTLGYA